MQSDSPSPLAARTTAVNVVASIAIALYVTCVIGNAFTTDLLMRRIAIVVGISICIVEFAVVSADARARTFLIAVGLWITIGVCWGAAYTGEFPVELGYVPGSLGIALALCSGHVSRRVSVAIVYGTGAIFIWQLSHIRTVAQLATVLQSGSANGISEIMILLTVTHYFNPRSRQAEIRLLPALVCLVVCTLTLGRSGIAASAVLVMGIAWKRVVDRPSRGRRWATVCQYTFCVAIIVAVIVPRLNLPLSVFTRFRSYGVTSEGRASVWSAYATDLNPVHVLFGFNRERVFGGFTNVHSSFLLWHKSMGIFAFGLVFVTAAALVLSLRRDRFLFLLLVVVLIRSAFDETTLPYRLLDFTILAIFASALTGVRRRVQPYAGAFVPLSMRSQI